jgi:hypothetical protein
VKTPVPESISTGWAGSTAQRVGRGIFLILLLWGMGADVALSRNAATFRQAFLTNALHAAGDGLSHVKFAITAETAVMFRPSRCSGPAKDQLCYEVRLTTPSGPRVPAVEEHFTIAVDMISGQAVVENTAKK